MFESPHSSRLAACVMFPFGPPLVQQWDSGRTVNLFVELSRRLQGIVLEHKVDIQSCVDSPGDARNVAPVLKLAAVFRVVTTRRHARAVRLVAFELFASQIRMPPAYLADLLRLLNLTALRLRHLLWRHITRNECRP